MENLKIDVKGDISLGTPCPNQKCKLRDGKLIIEKTEISDDGKIGPLPENIKSLNIFECLKYKVDFNPGNVITKVKTIEDVIGLLKLTDITLSEIKGGLSGNP